MDRREFLRGTATAVIPLFLSPLAAFAQQPQGNAPQPGAPQAAAAPPVNPQVLAVLRNWELKTASITFLSGNFTRYVYDSVFGVEKRADGRFHYQAPDLGRLDFAVPKELPNPPVNPGRTTKTGEPYKIVADTPQRWVCTGTKVLVIDDAMKQVQKIEIPPQLQGQNIADGPLPFLFGMKADKALKRYELTIGKMHSRETYHLVAKPLWKQDAQEWSQAEVLLNPANFLPKAIRTIDPAGTRDTVYAFHQETLDTSKALFAANPFDERRLGIGSYNVLQETTAEQPPEQRTVPRSVLR